MITPYISNQVLAGVNYFNQVFSDFNTNYNVQALGFITGAPYSNAPNMVIGNTLGAGGTSVTSGSFDPVGLTPPEGRNDITGHLTDQLSWVHGKHQFRFGGEYRQAQLDEFYKRHAVGSFTFDGTSIASTINNSCNDDGMRNGPTAQRGPTAHQGTCYYPDGFIAPLADFLSGRFSAASIAIGDPERQVFVNTSVPRRRRRLAGHAQTQHQLRHPLGLRRPARTTADKDMSVFRPELTRPAASPSRARDRQPLPAVLQELQSARRLQPTPVGQPHRLRAGFGCTSTRRTSIRSSTTGPATGRRTGRRQPGGSVPVYTVESRPPQRSDRPGCPLIFPSAHHLLSMRRLPHPAASSPSTRTSARLQRELQPTASSTQSARPSSHSSVTSAPRPSSPQPARHQPGPARRLRRPKQRQATRPYFAQLPAVRQHQPDRKHRHLQLQLAPGHLQDRELASLHQSSHLHLVAHASTKSRLPRRPASGQPQLQGRLRQHRTSTPATHSWLLQLRRPRQRRTGKPSPTAGSSTASLPSTAASRSRCSTSAPTTPAPTKATTRRTKSAIPTPAIQGEQPQRPTGSILRRLPTSSPGTFGNLRRNAFYGPGYS